MLEPEGRAAVAFVNPRPERARSAVCAPLQGARQRRARAVSPGRSTTWPGQPCGWPLCRMKSSFAAWLRWIRVELPGELRGDGIGPFCTNDALWQHRDV